MASSHLKIHGFYDTVSERLRIIFHLQSKLCNLFLCPSTASFVSVCGGTYDERKTCKITLLQYLSSYFLINERFAELTFMKSFSHIKPQAFGILQSFSLFLNVKLAMFTGYFSSNELDVINKLKLCLLSYS
jgi:hypothetical protein